MDPIKRFSSCHSNDARVFWDTLYHTYLHVYFIYSYIINNAKNGRMMPFYKIFFCILCAYIIINHKLLPINYINMIKNFENIECLYDMSILYYIFQILV